MLLRKSGHSPLAVEKLNMAGNVTVTVMQDSGLLKTFIVGIFPESKLSIKL